MGQANFSSSYECILAAQCLLKISAHRWIRIALNNLVTIFLLLKHKQNTNNMHLLAPKVIFISSTHYSLIEKIIIYHLRYAYSCLSFICTTGKTSKCCYCFDSKNCFLRKIIVACSATKEKHFFRYLQFAVS